MFAVTRVPCPICKKPGNGRHCRRLGYCFWMTCSGCSTKPGTKVVYDRNQRYFITNEEQ